MTVGSNLAAQVGIANESVVGTAVAVTTFTEFNTEGIDRRPNVAQGKGLRAGGLVPRSARRIEVSHDAGGPIEFDLPTKGLGKWLQAAFGSYTTTATQIASTTAWQQIHNLGSADGKTFTCQVGLPSIDGVVNPKTASGCKLLDWEITSGPNAIAVFKGTIDAMDVVPTGAGAAALQSASYSASTGMFSFKDLSITMASAATSVSGVWTPTSPATIGVVRNFSIKGGQPKDNTRWQAGSQTKAEPLVNDFQPITGQFDVDFADMTLYTAFAANTSKVIQAKFTGADAGGGNLFTLAFTMPAAFFENGSTPKATGPGINTVSYPFTADDDSVLGAIQALLISTDTTV